MKTYHGAIVDNEGMIEYEFDTPSCWDRSEALAFASNLAMYYTEGMNDGNQYFYILDDEEHSDA